MTIEQLEDRIEELENEIFLIKYHIGMNHGTYYDVQAVRQLLPSKPTIAQINALVGLKKLKRRTLNGDFVFLKSDIDKYIAENLTQWTSKYCTK